FLEMHGAGSGKLLHQCFRRLGVDVEEADLRALRDEMADDRFADSAAAAGDQHGPALQARIDGAAGHGCLRPWIVRDAGPREVLRKMLALSATRRSPGPRLF